MHWKRWLGILAVAAAVAAAVVYGFRPQPVLVEAEKLARGPLRVTVEEEGKTRITDTFVISAPVAGYAHRITLKAGDAVAPGQAITRIDPQRSTALDPRTRAESKARVGVASAAVEAARERVGAAEADATYWTAELARVEKLVSSGDVPRDRLDRSRAEQRRAQAALREAREQVRVAESELRAAQTTLDYASPTQADGAPAEAVEVRANVGGRVLNVMRQSEGVVQAGDGLIELANARSLEVVVELLSADAVKVAPGTRVIFTRWGGEKPLEGRVRKIEPVGFTKVSALGVEEQRVYVVADIVSPRQEWERLGAGYRVEAAFVLWENDSVVLVPSSALFRHGDGWAVFAVENGTARRKQVEVGRRSGLVAEVVAGVAEGAMVITHPDTAVEDGKMVQVR